MAGIQVGEVEKVWLNDRKRAVDQIRVAARHTVSQRDHITIATHGPLKQPYIEIFPGQKVSPTPSGIRQGTSLPMLPERPSPR
jgi:ABC-type transporter Mla subunit MlaD